MKLRALPLFHFSRPAAVAIALVSAAQAAETIDGGAVISVPGSQTSPWSVDGKLTVGGTGTGTLNIGTGGVVSSAIGVVGDATGSTGTVTVSGEGARWNVTDPTSTVGEFGLIVGREGNGSLTISSGGVVESASFVYVGGYGSGTTAIAPTGFGSLTVTGPGSRLESELTLTLGQAGGGSGTLLLSEGGTINSFQGRLQGGSTGVMTGAGTSWNIEIGIQITGTGSALTIQNGAVLSSNTVNTSMNGALTISGGGTVDFEETLGSDGTLIVRDGGILNGTGIAQLTRIGTAAGSTATGLVTGVGSQWNSTSNIVVGGSGNRNFSSSNSLTISNDGVVSVNDGAGRITLGSAYTTGTLNIGEGEAAGTVDALEVVGGSGTNSAARVNFNHTGSTTFEANLIGTNLSVTKTGSGTTTLTGANTYTQATTVTAGKLVNNGSLGNTAISVANGAFYGGNGTHTGSLTIQNGGSITPGASVGILNTGSLNLIGQAIYQWEISDAAGTAGTGWDLINVTGSATIGSTEANPFTIELLKSGSFANFDPSQDYSFTIAAVGGTISGFSTDNYEIDASDIAESSAGSWTLSQSGNSLVLSYSAIPEPSALLLSAIAATALVLRRGRSLSH